MTVPDVPESYNAALQECDRLIEHFDVRARRHKRTFNRYKYASIALTVGVTVIAALQGIYPPGLWWAWILPVVSGLAAFCTTMVSATNAQELWLRSRTMTQELNAERFLFLQGAGPYSEGDDLAKVKLFSTRLIELWTAGHDRWGDVIKKSGEALYTRMFVI